MGAHVWQQHVEVTVVFDPVEYVFGENYKFQIEGLRKKAEDAKKSGGFAGLATSDDIINYFKYQDWILSSLAKSNPDIENMVKTPEFLEIALLSLIEKGPYDFEKFKALDEQTITCVLPHPRYHMSKYPLEESRQ